jgi:hypothetical protein
MHARSEEEKKQKGRRANQGVRRLRPVSSYTFCGLHVEAVVCTKSRRKERWSRKQTSTCRESRGGDYSSGRQTSRPLRMAALAENVFQEQRGLCRSDGSATWSWSIGNGQSLVTSGVQLVARLEQSRRDAAGDF